MKKIVLVLVMLAFLFCITGCEEEAYLNGHTYTAYGVCNPEDKVDGVKYKVSMTNVVIAALCIETLVIPVIVIGWFLYMPYGFEENTSNDYK